MKLFSIVCQILLCGLALVSCGEGARINNLGKELEGSWEVTEYIQITRSTDTLLLNENLGTLTFGVCRDRDDFPCKGIREIPNTEPVEVTFNLSSLDKETKRLSMSFFGGREFDQQAFREKYEWTGTYAIHMEDQKLELLGVSNSETFFIRIRAARMN